MKAILTIFKKEWIDTLRDRRTIIAMVIIPLLLIPVMIGIVTKIAISQAKKAEQKVIKLGVISRGNASVFVGKLSEMGDFELIMDFPEDSVKSFIRNGTLDAALIFARNFDDEIRAQRSGKLDMYYESTADENISRRRIRNLVEEIRRDLLARRFAELNLDESVIETVDLVENDVASEQEKIGKFIGGFLPYMFVIFCFMGAMYPAIDLGAGEKERGTLETLLASPASRLEILLGKFGVVALTGLTSAGLAIVGIYLGIRQVADIPEEILSTLLGLLEVKAIVTLLSLLLPLTVFFGAILLGLSIFAKSFKEAQSIITPLNIVVILPAAVGLFPGIELNFVTALIPVLNVSLATREILAGTATLGSLIPVYLSLFLLAGVSLWVCSKWFGREETIFRM